MLKLGIQFITRISVGAVFLYAGIAKSLDLNAFHQQIIAMNLLPVGSEFAVALGLCGLEILFGLLLLVGLWTRTAAFGVSVLLLGFMVVLINAMLGGTATECGCFGTGEALDGWTVLRDLGLLALSIFIMQAKTHRYAMDGWIEQRKQIINPKNLYQQQPNGQSPRSSNTTALASKTLPQRQSVF
jgi:uncharacterized membrane protein YphA (DoxX/SURF4 family)